MENLVQILICKLVFHHVRFKKIMFNIFKTILNKEKKDSAPKSQKTGFTLIESLVAITVLTFSITGATSIVQSSLSNSALVKARGQAIGLAVEGVEYVRHLHDIVVLEGRLYESGVEFYDFVDTCGDDGCELEANIVQSDGQSVKTNYTSCNSNCYLAIGENGYQWERRGGEQTVYRREVKASTKNIDGGKEFKITSIVNYNVRGQSQNIVYTSLLYLPNNPEPEE